jgi:hypothetical protein
MNGFLRYLFLFIASYTTFLAGVRAQSATIIQANEAAAHIGQYATVEGVVAKVFTSKTGYTFLNLGPVYPKQTFTPLGRSKQYWDRSRIFRD